MKLPDTRSGGSKFLPLLLLCIPVAWFAVLFAQAAPPGSGLRGILDGLTIVLNDPFEFVWTDWTWRYFGIFLLIYAVCMAVYYSTRRNYRRGGEQGSATWGSAGQIAKRYQAPKSDENLILTKHFRMGLDGHKHRRNLNVLVVGGSGAGKTRFYARAQHHAVQCLLYCYGSEGEAVALHRASA